MLSSTKAASSTTMRNGLEYPRMVGSLSGRPMTWVLLGSSKPSAMGLAFLP